MPCTYRRTLRPDVLIYILRDAGHGMREDLPHRQGELQRRLRPQSTGPAGDAGHAMADWASLVHGIRNPVRVEGRGDSRVVIPQRLSGLRAFPSRG